jgi:hypothetical protein
VKTSQEWFKPSELIVDPIIQQRAGGIDEEYAGELAELVKAKGQFKDLPVVFRDKANPGAGVILAGGFHRHAAVVIAGQKLILCEVREGTRRDALAYALGDNADHGRPRSAADKRKAVETALADPEWSKLSDRQIDDLCAVSYGLTSRVRKELTGAAPDPQKSAAGRKANESRKPAGADRPHPKGSGVKDRLGRPVPARLAEAFDPANAGEGGPICYLCPACEGDKDETDCPTCGGRGGLNEAQHAALSPLLKEQAEFRAREQAAAEPTAPATWRDRPVKDAGKISSGVAAKFHLNNVHTCGQLADRIDRGETLGLIPGVLDDLRESLARVSDGEWPKADGLGRPIPARLRDAFADTYLDTAADQLAAVAAKLKAASSWNPWLKPTVWDQLTRLVEEIRGCKPFAACSCGGSGCEGCLTGGFLPAWQGPELQQQAKQRKK